MAISFSRPDPASPSAVGSASFGQTRRGYDQGEVRDFLRMVAAELARLQERERFLETELRDLQTRGMSAPGRLDEETVTTILGEEAARVLGAARDAGAEIRVRAEESATRMIQEAAEDAKRIRAAASEEAQRIRDDIAVDVEAEIELAKQQGRELVIEARQYREKMLGELSRRRDAARAQIEKLVKERDRLVAAFQRAKMSADDALAFLSNEHHEDDEFIFDFARGTEPTGPMSIVTESPELERSGVSPDHPSVSSSSVTVSSSNVFSSNVSPSNSGIFDYTKDLERPADERSPGERSSAERHPSDPRVSGRRPVEPRDTERRVPESSTVSDVRQSPALPTRAEGPRDRSGERPRGMPNLPGRPGFLGPASEESRSDAFGPVDTPATDSRVSGLTMSDIEAGDEEELEQADTREPIITSLGELERRSSDPESDPETDIESDIEDVEVIGRSEPGGETSAHEHLAPVVALFGDRRRPTAEPEPEVVLEPEPDVDVAREMPSRLDDIFARLRSSSAAAVSAAARKSVAATTSRQSTTTAPATAKVPATTKVPATAKVRTKPTSRTTPKAPAQPKGQSQPKAPARPKDRSQPTENATPTSTIPQPVSDPRRFARRASDLGPIAVDIDKRLKRVINDELNEVLDRISQRRSTISVDSVLGISDDHVRRVAEAITAEFVRAATAGAESMRSSRGSAKRIRTEDLDLTLEQLVSSMLVDQLRADVEAAIIANPADRGELGAALRGVYRDIKSTVDATATDLAHAGYSRGAYLSLEPGTKVCWMVDPDGPDCADGEDNSLGGYLTCGESFPTGDTHPLAHPGCRCLLGPAQH